MTRALTPLLLSCLLGVSACSQSAPPPPNPLSASSDTTIVNIDVANTYIGTGNAVPAQPYTYNRITDGLKTPGTNSYSNGYTTIETVQATPEASNYAAITPSGGISQAPREQTPVSSSHYSSNRSAGDPYGRAPSFERTVGGGLMGGVTGGLIGAACCGNPIVGAGTGIVIGIIGGVIAGAAIDATYPEK